MAEIDHVLVVDDDRDIRELVTACLEKQGLRCTAAEDGRAMRSALQRATPDVIVLDLMLPGDDGLALCREIRSGKHRAIPILMLTARDDETDRIVGLELGADDYMSKPFAARMLPPNRQATETASLIGFGAWRLDPVARHLLAGDDVAVALSSAVALPERLPHDERAAWLPRLERGGYRYALGPGQAGPPVTAPHSMRLLASVTRALTPGHAFTGSGQAGPPSTGAPPRAARLQAS